MKKLFIVPVLALAIILTLVGCGLRDGNVTVTPTPGIQVSPIPSPDTSPGTSPGTSPDTSPEMSPEMSPDMSPDLSPNVSSSPDGGTTPDGK